MAHLLRITADEPTVTTVVELAKRLAEKPAHGALPTLVFGRGPDVDVSLVTTSLPDLMSRAHAVVCTDQMQYFVRDKSSTNGTYVRCRCSGLCANCLLHPARAGRLRAIDGARGNGQRMPVYTRGLTRLVCAFAR
jgi:hypothetical protein